MVYGKTNNLIKNKNDNNNNNNKIKHDMHYI